MVGDPNEPDGGVAYPPVNCPTTFDLSSLLWLSYQLAADVAEKSGSGDGGGEAIRVAIPCSTALKEPGLITAAGQENLGGALMAGGAITGHWVNMKTGATGKFVTEKYGYGFGASINSISLAKYSSLSDFVEGADSIGGAYENPFISVGLSRSDPISSDSHITSPSLGVNNPYKAINDLLKGGKGWVFSVSVTFDLTRIHL